MDKWEALKQQLEKIGRGERVYSGHILIMMDKLEVDPEWDLKKEWILLYTNSPKKELTDEIEWLEQLEKDGIIINSILACQ